MTFIFEKNKWNRHDVDVIMKYTGEKPSYTADGKLHVKIPNGEPNTAAMELFEILHLDW